VKCAFKEARWNNRWSLKRNAVTTKRGLREVIIDWLLIIMDDFVIRVEGELEYDDSTDEDERDMMKAVKLANKAGKNNSMAKRSHLTEGNMATYSTKKINLNEIDVSERAYGNKIGTDIGLMHKADEANRMRIKDKNDRATVD
jgi:RIO kinase 1